MPSEYVLFAKQKKKTKWKMSTLHLFMSNQAKEKVRICSGLADKLEVNSSDGCSSLGAQTNICVFIGQHWCHQISSCVPVAVWWHTGGEKKRKKLATQVKWQMLQDLYFRCVTAHPRDCYNQVVFVCCFFHLRWDFRVYQAALESAA